VAAHPPRQYLPRLQANTVFGVRIEYGIHMWKC
jgi:hypothetical protein